MKSAAAGSQLRIGILGVKRGILFARAMAFTPGVEPAALCARHRDGLEKAADGISGPIELFTSYEEMLASDIDAVIVATAPSDHLAHTLQALDAGKHVLSEVPAVTDLDDATRLLEAVRASGLKYMFAENFCYMRHWSLVTRLVEAGLLGEPVYGEGRLLFQANFLPPEEAQRWSTHEWAMRRGHPYATHYWGPLHRIFQEPLRTVSCLGSGQHHKPWAVADDTSVVLGNTPSGKLIQLRVDFFTPRPGEGYIGLDGTEGCCRIWATGSDADQFIHIHGTTPRGEWQSLYDFSDHLGPEWDAVPKDTFEYGYDSGLPLLVGDFARSIHRDERPPIDVVDALNMTVPGLVSAKSREQGGIPVEVPHFTRES